MKKDTLSINQVIANPELLNQDGCWSFYDWFCKDTSLENKAKNLIKKVKILVDMKIIDGDKNYVWFKNNCPMSGRLYDDIRISRISDGEFLGGFCPKSGFTNDLKPTSFWILEGGEVEALSFETWSEMKKVLSNPDHWGTKLFKNKFN